MATLAAKLRLDIVTPLGTAWAGEADEVRLPSVFGEMGVLPGHRPLLAAVRAGVVLLRRAETVERLAVGRGFAEVGAAKVVLLVDRCAEGSRVDRPLVEQELVQAQAAIEAFSGPRTESQFEELAHERDYQQACLTASEPAGAVH